jgi:Dolichyl-phosphate-mannose-protein mannosyltransferase
MPEVASILFGAGFTVAVSVALGSLLLGWLRVRLYRTEAALIEFIAGSAVLSLAVTLLCLAHQARKGGILVGGIAAIVVAIWRARRAAESRRTLPAIRLDWLVLFSVVFSAFGIYYFFNAMAPEVSPDGSGYHLGNVARTLRHHGFDWNFHSMYAYLSQGAEMLFLVAFAFGRHSAAALVHFAFLCTLPLLMVCYGRRFGFPKAALFAALLVFASPVIAKDGVSAYNDLVVVTLIYAVFYLLQVWDEEQSDNLLILIGLLSGFAYGVKYTAALTLPFAIGWLAWRRSLNLRALARIAVPAALIIAPWVLRNWIWVGNPVAPFLNAWFPNPYYHAGMERIYVDLLAHYLGIKHWWQIPLELTLRGELVSGTFSVVFLMLPLSLIALRTPAGRRLLLTAVIFAVPAWFNIGARFLIPSAPFAALALGLALETVPAALPVLGLFTVLTSWPTVVSAYSDPANWRINTYPKEAALRRVTTESYLSKNLQDYELKQILESSTRPDERIFSFAGRPDAYIDRDIWVSYESTLGNLVQDILWTPQEHFPRRRARFRFLPLQVRGVRVVNNASDPNFWSVAEMRVFFQGKELPRDASWRIRAWPNTWEAPLAFDNSYATRWSTWQAMSPHARIEIIFPTARQVDEVALELQPAKEAKLQVDVLIESGRWIPMTDTVEYVKQDPPPGVRQAASREIKALGFRYLLVNSDDLVYEDFKKYFKFWGITELAQVHGTHFYRID